jgi:TetR/AcrR family transcriptional regulator, transcriptional repressor for nem operon
MARILKEDEYNAKRNEILDFAMSLVYTKGYDQLTIQAILDGMDISRGALYHYFASKSVLVEAMINRTAGAAEANLRPIVQDPQRSALQKLQGYFQASAGWKNAQKELILGLLRRWYTDENMLIRQKMTSESLKALPRLIEPIIRQGIEEGVFTTRYPAEVAVIFAGVALSLTDSIIALLLTPDPDQAAYQKSQALMAAYIESIERILGAAPGSLNLFDMDVFKDWWSEPLKAAES